MATAVDLFMSTEPHRTMDVFILRKRGEWSADDAGWTTDKSFVNYVKKVERSGEGSERKLYKLTIA